MGKSELQHKIMRNSLILYAFYLIVMLYRILFEDVHFLEYIFGLTIITYLAIGMKGARNKRTSLMTVYQVLDSIYVVILSVVGFYTIFATIGCLFNDTCTLINEEPNYMLNLGIFMLNIVVSIYIYVLHIKTIYASMCLSKRVSRSNDKKARKSRTQKRKQVKKEQQVEEGYPNDDPYDNSCAFSDDGTPLIMMQPVPDITTPHYPQLQPVAIDTRSPSINPAYIANNANNVSQEDQDRALAQSLQDQYNDG
jgi:hypothetical protein